MVSYRRPVPGFYRRPRDRSRSRPAQTREQRHVIPLKKKTEHTGYALARAGEDPPSGSRSRGAVAKGSADKCSRRFEWVARVPPVVSHQSKPL